jgi:hypothetical protein
MPDSIRMELLRERRLPVTENSCTRSLVSLLVIFGVVQMEPEINN